MRNGLASIVKKRYISYAVIGNFFCLLAAASASEPTLQETIDFIQRKAAGECIYHTTPRLATKGSKIVEEGPIGYTEKSGYRITLLDHNTILVKEEVVKLFHELFFYRPSARNIIVSKGEETWSTWTAKIRLADLSTNVEIKIPAKMRTEQTGRNIVVECTKGDCIEWKETNRKKEVTYAYDSSESRLPDRQKSSSSYILFTICDQEDAEKIKKALTHAIRISGGKDELF